MNLIGAPYQIIIGKQTDGDLLEFKEVGKESEKLKLKDIINLITEQKIKIDFYTRKRNYIKIFKSQKKTVF